MAKIILLPEELRNRIAAGEVVERPASVVKELIENSIDAGADKIRIELRRAGKNLIKVSDNGGGMDEEDLHLSIQSHATSKIKNLEDLYNIRTLGFRGEALPSIAAVSFLKITSRDEGSDLASYLVVEGGKLREEGKVNHPKGTTVEVKNLFFNTPARRKFLKSDNTELAHIVDVVTKFCISYPEIEFRLSHNDRVLLDLKRSNLKGRIEELFPEVRGKLIYVEAENNLFKLKAYLSKPEINYPRRIKQYTFVNGRAVANNSLYHAIDEAYQGLIEGKKFPVVFLFMEMEPQLLDVNIHPTKREIKFRREREVHDLLRGILRDELAGEEIITTMEMKEEAPPSLDQEGKFYQPTIKELEQEFDLVREVQRELLRLEGSGEYLVYKDKFIIWLDEEGINILDQHAGCEKILYEKLKDAWEGKGIEVQRLLLPEVLNLDLKTATFLRQNLDLFNRIGFEIKEFGENSFIIQTKPQLLKGKPKDIIKEVISDLLEKEEIKDMFEAVIASLACHSAIKGGDRLSEEEIHKLVQEVKDLDRPYCPHGRPAWVVIKWEDIEKRFGRG